MTTDHKKYLLIESLVSVVINAAISALFVWLIFRHQSVIPLTGPKGIIFDFLPQTFGVAFMAILVPTLITRARLKAGKISLMDSDPITAPSNILLRCALLAFIAACIVFTLATILMPVVASAQWSLKALYAFKAIYGGSLAFIMTWIGLSIELRRERAAVLA